MASAFSRLDKKAKRISLRVNDGKRVFKASPAGENSGRGKAAGVRTKRESCQRPYYELGMNMYVCYIFNTEKFALLGSFYIPSWVTQI